MERAELSQSALNEEITGDRSARFSQTFGFDHNVLMN